MSQVKRARRFPERVQEVIEKLRKSNGLDAFQKLLPVEAIDAVLTDVGHTFRDRLYTPAVSLWVFLSQALSTESLLVLMPWLDCWRGGWHAGNRHARRRREPIAAHGVAFFPLLPTGIRS